MAIVRKATEHRRIFVVAPKSQGMTWDAIRDGFGHDVQAIDRALAHVFEHYDVRTEKVAIGGFSDGGTYALTLGLTNGNLFHEILAFSPGFIASRRMNGRPRVYIAHGRSDTVLPFERTGARLAAQLTTAGYEVRFDPFDGGHTVPGANVTAAFDWWLGG